MNHVGYIVAEYPHPNLPSAGGIGSFVKTMANSLVKRQCGVTVFVCFSDRDLIWYDGAIKIVEVKKVKPSKLAPILDRLRIRNVVRKHIRKTNIQLVEAADWEGLQAFCNFEIPLITRIHGSVSYFNYIQKINQSKVIKFFERSGLKKSNKVIAVSRFSGELTQEVFHLPNLSFEVVYNGVNLKKFKTVADKESTNNKMILYFGTLVRKKGVIELAYIFNELYNVNPEVELVLVGKDAIDYIEDKSTWSIMKHIFTESALKRVTYKGVVEYEEMNKIIDQTDICVFPSFAEAFPISWLEAMALEKPIVASSIGWATESIIDEESGLLEHPENHAAFAKKINSILKNDNLAESLGIEAQKRVTAFFNQDDLVNKNINIYKKLISNE